MATKRREKAPTFLWRRRRGDNLPNTVVESLVCGTAVVAFCISGLPDLVDPGENGYLAEPFSAEDLAQGIGKILTQGEASPQLSQ